MQAPITVREITTIEEMLRYHSIIQQLSPALCFQDYEELLQLMIPNNYHMAGAYESDVCIGISGYWLGAKLYSGKYIEIDNFVIDEAHRSKGAGKLLLDWMLEEARKFGCKHAMLDAYVENFKAHAFYYREGFIARGFHYLKKL